ncbi:MAG TPA: hypothetical protein VMZ31_17195, partial [Phycisphaerae bacterium]|nr:hypothetical protein [Phycisphaerae bacterium]
MNPVRQVALGVIIVCALVATPAHATRWLLVDFHDGDSQSTFGTQFPTWNQIIRHSGNTAYVDPDGNPDHEGIADSGSSPGNGVTYYGIQGTAPINFQPPHRIIATFYNRSGALKSIYARCSLSDPDSANGAGWNTPWNTMFPASGSRSVWPYSMVEMAINVTVEGAQLSPLALPTAGQHYLINIGLGAFDPDFVLTKIELTNEADITAPNPPVNLQANMVQVSTEAGQSVVELTWTEPSDPGGSNGVSSGVNRYYVYRNDGTGMELHGSVTSEWASYFGTNVFWRDYEVRANASYSYEVVAVDGATRGWPFWPGNTNSTRSGNESSSATVSINVPNFSYGAALIDPVNDLTYVGAVRLPATTTPSKWGYAGQGLTYYPGGNPGYNPATELPGSLYGMGFTIDNMVGELSIPIPVNSTNINDLPRANELQGFARPYPFTQSGSTQTYAHIGYHPGGNGVGDHVYYSYYRFYNGPLDEPAHGALYMNLSQTGVGAWFVGGPYGDANHIPWALTSRFCFQIPQAWADVYANGRSLVYGSGGQLIAGHGDINLTGPSFFAVAPWETGSLPAHNGYVGANTLMRYGQQAQSQDTWLESFNTQAHHLDAVWLENGGKRAIIVASRLGRGQIWYGYHEAAMDQLIMFDIPETSPTGGGGKGWCSTDQRALLSFYNVSDLERVVGGSMQQYEPRPYAYFDVQDYYIATKNYRYPPEFSLAVDNTNGYLFLIDGCGENGDQALIHVWQLGGGGPSNQAPIVDAGSNQSITLPTDTVNLDGTVSDDGLPNPPATVTTTWTKFSGPGTVTFGNANAVDTTATFSTDGVYVLQLLADDSLLQSTDTVTITVNPAAGGEQDANITTANSYDDAWESGPGGWVEYCQGLYTAWSGTTGFVVHLGDSITYANPFGQWARYGSGKTQSDIDICNWMHSDVWGDGTNNSANGWYLAAYDMPGGRSFTAESGIQTDQYLVGSMDLPSMDQMYTPGFTNPDGKQYLDSVMATILLGTNDASSNRT